MQVAVLIRTSETYRVQLEEPLGDLKKGAKLMLNRSKSPKRTLPPTTTSGGLGLSTSLVVFACFRPCWQWSSVGCREELND